MPMPCVLVYVSLSWRLPSWRQVFNLPETPDGKFQTCRHEAISEEVDGVLGVERDDGLLPVGLAPAVDAEPAFDPFALAVLGPDLGDADAEEELDGGLDLVLGRPG